MKRFCSTCKAWVEPTLNDRRNNQICPTCKKDNIHFSLRQRAMLRQLVRVGDSVSVSAVMFSRGGQSGYVVGNNMEGASIDFLKDVDGGTAGPSIEHYNWDELDVSHLITRETEPFDPSSFVNWRVGFDRGDYLMLRDGAVLVIEGKCVVKRKRRFEVWGLSASPSIRTVGEETLPKIVDWLSAGDHQPAVMDGLAS